MLTKTFRVSFLSLFAFAAIATCAPNSEAAGRGWGWQKPYNQRLGAFYTSNRANYRNKSTVRRSSNYRTPSSWSSRGSKSRSYDSSPTFIRPPRIIPFDGFPAPYGYPW